MGRESTVTKDGKYIKDFSYLGRPIKDVIYIDFTKEIAPFHTGNTILLPEFKGDMDDRALYDIIPFLDCKLTDCFERPTLIMISLCSFVLETD